MDTIKIRLLSVSVFKNILETDSVKCLLALCNAETAENAISAYSGLVYTVWREGYKSLSESILWHLKYDDSFFGKKMAAEEVPAELAEAASRDIEVLSEISRVSCAELKKRLLPVCSAENHEFAVILEGMPELQQGNGFTAGEIFDSFRYNGCGRFALGRAFHWENGVLTMVQKPDALRPEEMFGYEYQRNAVIENTRALVNGFAANNVLLYGDSGTGKSATIKSLICIPEFYNLRIVEIARNSLAEITQLVRMLGSYTQKFIVYIDDLSFEKEDRSFSELKTALEGGLSSRPANVIICATSNRRHMIRESFSDRQGDDVHARETLEERTSLSERFGLRLAYLALDKKHYLDMVLEMCRQQNISMERNAIMVEANRWEIQHGGRTPRVAVQLLDKLAGQNQKETPQNS